MAREMLRNKHKMLTNPQTADVIPADKAQPSASSRPIITNGTPQHTDNTLTAKPEPLMSHQGKSIEPSAGFVAQTKPGLPFDAPAASVPNPVPPPAPASPQPAFPPADPIPAPPAIPTAPVSEAASVAAAPTAPVPIAKPAEATVPSTVPVKASAVPAMPSVSPPPMPPAPTMVAPKADKDADELDLSTLTGVHNVSGTAAAAEPRPAVSASPQSNLPAKTVADEALQGISQTPQQALKLAAALRELKHHPAAPPQDGPVVVVHQHQYGRALLLFAGSFIGAVLLALIVMDLLADANLISIPFYHPLTHFFH